VPCLPIGLPAPILGVWLLSGPRFQVGELEVNCRTKDCRKLSLPDEKGWTLLEFMRRVQRTARSPHPTASEHRSSVPCLPIGLPAPILGVWLLSGPRFQVGELEVNCRTKDCRKLSLPDEKGWTLFEFMRSLVWKCNVVILE